MDHKDYKLMKATASKTDVSTHGGGGALIFPYAYKLLINVENTHLLRSYR